MEVKVQLLFAQVDKQMGVYSAESAACSDLVGSVLSLAERLPLVSSTTNLASLGFFTQLPEKLSFKHSQSLEVLLRTLHKTWYGFGVFCDFC